MARRERASGAGDRLAGSLATRALRTFALAVTIALGPFAPAERASAAAQDQPAPGEYGRVGYAKLDGTIDRLRARFLERVVEDARAEELDTLIVHIDTDGGELGRAREMFKTVIDQMDDGPRMIAFVDFRAISAGAMIAYAHEALYLSEAASIGDIGVIFINREGEMEYAPEKIETVVRSLLAQAAEQRGWNRALLLKMTARNQKLYRLTAPDADPRFIIEDDLPEYLSEHPELDLEDPKQIVVYRGEDRLLTMTGREAAKLGMATGNADDIEALYSKLGIEPADVVDLGPSIAESTAWLLSTAAPLLAGLTLLFIMFELKTPGVGLWAMLGAVTAAGFLLSQYYLDLAENLEVVLIVVGLGLVAAETFLLLTGGVLAIAGGVVAFMGLLLAFLPNELEFDFDDPIFREALSDAMVSSLAAVGVVIVGVLLFIRLLPASGFGRRIAVEASIDSTTAGELEQAEQTLAGRTGRARGRLRPSGTVVVDGTDYSARSEHGAYVDAGAEIEVVRVEFGELVVRATAEATPDVT